MSNNHGMTKATALDKLVNQAMGIEDLSAQAAGEVGFMARAMALATLPHRSVEGSVYQRKNGNFVLTLMSPPDVGIPFGTIPRLVLLWLTTEAVRTQSRELELGHSMSEFMGDLGLVPSGGRWGSITRLKTQTNRLFNSTVNARWVGVEGSQIINQQVAASANLWWHPREDKQAALWQSTVVLGEQFFKEVIEHPVPVDLRAIRALKQSAMALDIYVWLTHRSIYLKLETVIPWVALAAQFGADYKRPTDFRVNFQKALQRVYVVYKDANFSVTEQGLVLRPALTHVGRKRS
jgi:hypothetical protein